MSPFLLRVFSSWKCLKPLFMPGKCEACKFHAPDNFE